ncbi:MAG: cyclic pyranopterin monophosphate synthase MoaC [Promethearchaeota archaeon]
MSHDKVSMIDISDKKPMKRIATATGKIILKPETIQKIKNGTIKKGNPLVVGEIAAINAVKMTPQLIPLCHQIPITNVDFQTRVLDDHIEVETTVTSIAQTGVEMEALVGTTTFLNVIWDMTKYIEKDEKGQYPSTTITDIRVIRKEKLA